MEQPFLRRPGVICYNIGGVPFDIPVEYTPIRPIGQGSYGFVCSAIHTPTNQKVAIKKITNAFRNLIDTKRNLREIKLLRHFHHDNIISLIDLFKPPSRTNFDDIYIVSDLMDTDLEKILKSPQVLSDDHIQYFLYQILRGLKHIHSANVMHRDLKPSNIYCNEDCSLKIGDFGLARIHNDSLTHVTEYVATRWYRAPEVILSWKEYTKAIDIWSVGCIFAEMLTRRPLFQGSDYIHQVVRITDIVGTPPPEDLLCLASEQARRFMAGLGYKPKTNWSQLIPGSNPLALDLLDKMLQFSPHRRCSVEEALAHPYLESLHDPDDEPTAAQAFDFDFEQWQLTPDVFRELIFREICAVHPEVMSEVEEAQQMLVPSPTQQPQQPPPSPAQVATGQSQAQQSAASLQPPEPSLRLSDLATMEFTQEELEEILTNPFVEEFQGMDVSSDGINYP